MLLFWLTVILVMWVNRFKLILILKVERKKLNFQIDMSASKRFFVSFFRRINNIWKITFMVNMSTQLNYKTKHVSKEIYLTKLYLHYSVSIIFFCFLFYLCPWISLSLCLLYLFLLVSPLSLCLPVSLSHLLCLFVSLSISFCFFLL